jgi:hypothetical protein
LSYSFSFLKVPLLLTLSRIAANVEAAWGRRGFPLQLGRAQKAENQHKLSGEPRPRLRQTARWLQVFFLFSLRKFVINIFPMCHICKKNCIVFKK